MCVCGWVGHRANAKGKPRTALSTLLQQAAGLHIRDVLLNNDNDVASEAKKEKSRERKGERVACPGLGDEQRCGLGLTDRRFLMLQRTTLVCLPRPLLAHFFHFSPAHSAGRQKCILKRCTLMHHYQKLPYKTRKSSLASDCEALIDIYVSV